MVMKKPTAVVVGFGGRGSCYARYTLDQPDELEIVGVADANSIRREAAKKRHNNPDQKREHRSHRDHGSGGAA